MHATGFRLGIDFGTSHTVAVLVWPDGRAKPLLFDGSPLLPSAVYWEPAGGLATGRDAVHSARLDPSRYEPNPKRRIDHGTVLLGGLELPVVGLIAAVLQRVVEEARRTAGGLPGTVTITVPAAWAATRRRILTDAAGLAGLERVDLVEEPVAAASYFAQTHDTPPGSVVVVYDLGGGTFDVSVVERTEGFRTIAVAGRDDIGGLDLDHALVRRIGELYGAADPAAWHRLTDPATPEDRRARRLLWDDVRSAKERLSRHPAADLHVPVLDREVHLTREEFDRLAQPLVHDTVQLTRSVLADSGVEPARVSGVFLVGGSSRIPLVATAVHQGLQIAPTVLEQPELVVAEGAVLRAAAGSAATVQLPAVPAPPVPPATPAATPNPPAPTSPAPAFPAPTSPAPGAAPFVPAQAASGRMYDPGPARSRRRLWYAVAAVLVAAALGIAGYAFWPTAKATGDTPRDATDPTGDRHAGAQDHPDQLPDLLYQGEHPMLRSYDGKWIILEDADEASTVIAVPEAWVVTFTTGNQRKAAILSPSGRYVVGPDPTSRVSVSTDGTMAAFVDDRHVTVYELPGGDPRAETDLPAGGHTAGWAGHRLLVQLGNGTYDSWDLGQGGYQQTGSGATLEPLGGRADNTERLVGITGDKCLAMYDVPDDFQQIGDPACDSPLNLKRNGDDALPIVSPDGRTLLAYDGDGHARVVAVDDLLDSAQAETVELDIDGASIARVAWENRLVFVQTADDGYFRCGTSEGRCTAITLPEGKAGAEPVRPVVRFGFTTG